MAVSGNKKFYIWRQIKNRRRRRLVIPQRQARNPGYLSLLKSSLTQHFLLASLHSMETRKWGWDSTNLNILGLNKLFQIPQSQKEAAATAVLGKSHQSNDQEQLHPFPVATEFSWWANHWRDSVLINKYKCWVLSFMDSKKDLKEGLRVKSLRTGPGDRKSVV